MADKPVSYEQWQRDLAFERRPGAQRETAARNSQYWYNNYVRSWNEASPSARRAMDQQHGFGSRDSGGGKSSSSGGSSGPPRNVFPGTKYPGFQNINPEQLYKQWDQKAAESLLTIFKDPHLRRIHAARAAATVGLPPNWRSVMNTPVGGQGGAPGSTPSATPPRPYPQSIDRLLSSIYPPRGYNQSVFPKFDQYITGQSAPAQAVRPAQNPTVPPPPPPGTPVAPPPPGALSFTQGGGIFGR